MCRDDGVLKALVVRVPAGADVGDVLQIARAEGMKIFRGKAKVEVVDLIRRDYGWVVVVRRKCRVVQVPEVVSGGASRKANA